MPIFDDLNLYAMQEKSIQSLIHEDVVYAKVLDQLGVQFYESRHKTLAELCSENNIDIERFLIILEKSNSRRTQEYLDLRNYPIRLIVAYLKHSHQIFVKDTLPYILKKVAELEQNDTELVVDLQTVLPMFIEDFIHHIYEEEDRLFTYVCELESAVNGLTDINTIKDKIENFSIQEFALEHNDSDNEMKGIRGITNNYSTVNVSNGKLELLLTALRQFDEELTRHAHIENDILFAKAISMEKNVKQMLYSKAGMN